MCKTLSSSRQHFQVESQSSGPLLSISIPFPILAFTPNPEAKKMPSIWGNQEIVLMFSFMTQTYILMVATVLFLPAHSSFIATG